MGAANGILFWSPMATEANGEVVATDLNFNTNYGTTYPAPTILAQTTSSAGHANSSNGKNGTIQPETCRRQSDSKALLEIALSLGIPLLIALFTIACMAIKLRRNKATMMQSPDMKSTLYDIHSGWQQSSGSRQMHARCMPPELHDNDMPYEAPSHGWQRR